MNIRNTILTMTLGLVIGSANATSPPPSQTTTPCPEGTVTCNTSNQHMGDTSSSADNTQTQSSNSGTSSADNNASVAVTSGENNLQQSGNAVTQSPEITSTITGGNTQSQATGGSSNSSSKGNDTDVTAINEGNLTR